MKLYAVHIEDDDSPYEYFATLREANHRRAECPGGYGAIDRIGTSADMSMRDLVLAVLNRDGWVAQRVEIKADKPWPKITTE